MAEHYNARNSLPPWAVINDWYSDFPANPALVYYLGDALAYMCRAGHKDSLVQDLEKAKDYLEEAIRVATGALEEEPIEDKEEPTYVWEDGVRPPNRPPTATMDRGNMCPNWLVDGAFIQEVATDNTFTAWHVGDDSWRLISTFTPIEVSTKCSDDVALLYTYYDSNA